VENIPGNNTTVGTVVGAVFAFVGAVTTTDLIRAIVLAAVGAIVSFFVTLALNWLKRKFKNQS
jgi:CDP-diglyceride synthetase